MIDRERVIRGLERCTSVGYDSCAGCPYSNSMDLPEGGGCVDATQKDALALLKEQEPKVMTLEEAINGNQVGYVEFRYHPDCGWVKCDFTLPDDEVALMLSTTKVFYQETPDYKRLWRLWTSRPAYEQMEATPWDMPEEGGETVNVTLRFTPEQQRTLCEALSGLCSLYEMESRDGAEAVRHAAQLLRSALAISYEGGGGVGILSGWVSYYREIESNQQSEETFARVTR